MFLAFQFLSSNLIILVKDHYCSKFFFLRGKVGGDISGIVMSLWKTSKHFIHVKESFIVIIKKFAECLSQQELLTLCFAGADHKAGCI